MRRLLPFAVTGLVLLSCIGDDPSGSLGDTGPDGGTSEAEGGAPTGALDLTVKDVTLSRGANSELEVTVLRAAAIKDVVVRVEGLPDGVSAAEIALGPNETTAKLVLAATPTAAFGRTSVTVRVAAAHGGPQAEKPASLLVRGAHGELDTSFGPGGSVPYTALGLAGAIAGTAAIVHQGTLFLSAAAPGGAITILALRPSGAIDPTRFGAGQGRVQIAPPPPFSGVALAPQLSVNGQNALVVDALYKPAAGTNSGFARYTLPFDAPAGTFAPQLSASIPLPSIAFSGIFAFVADGSGHFALGLTKAGSPEFGLPFLSRRDTTTGGVTWPGSSPAERIYGGTATTGDTTPGEPTGSEQYTASASNVYLAIAALRPGQIKPRVWVQPRDGAGAVTFLLDVTLPSEPNGALHLSRPSATGDVFLDVQRNDGQSCVFRLRGLAAPATVACRASLFNRGVFALDPTKLALMTAQTGGAIRMHLVTESGAPVPGWESPTGATVIASGPPKFAAAAVLEDADEGILVVERESAASGGAIRRLWN